MDFEKLKKRRVFCSRYMPSERRKGLLLCCIRIQVFFSHAQIKFASNVMKYSRDSKRQVVHGEYLCIYGASRAARPLLTYNNLAIRSYTFSIPPSHRDCYTRELAQRLLRYTEYRREEKEYELK
ncbi:unnamed protein product [Trichogramma brassicae]|uniref:Uncharacterized protein n=1 Tax=Trichogramma brassicae TaxID=86971 RepID=A0A6H5IJ48_9HYME|nr:unnamed protein product [Trichogramma brassicae]